jgi:hypothetical protein
MYDYSKLIERIEDKDWHEMMETIQSEIRTAERNAYSGKPGCVKHREMGAPQYAAKLKSLAFFLGQGAMPGSAGASEIAIYRRITEKLIEKGQFKPEARNLFNA